MNKADPSSEKSNKLSSLHSILAPKSNTTDIPFLLGQRPANAGLSTLQTQAAKAQGALVSGAHSVEKQAGQVAKVGGRRRRHRTHRRKHRRKHRRTHRRHRRRTHRRRR